MTSAASDGTLRGGETDPSGAGGVSRVWPVGADGKASSKRAGAGRGGAEPDSAGPVGGETVPVAGFRAGAAAIGNDRSA